MNRSEIIESLFHKALDLPPGEREAFLRKSCGDDPDLLDEIQSLVSAHETGSDFFEQPAWSSLVKPQSKARPELDALEPEEGLPFERLGEFRLIRRLGEGGMGVVYLAVQESLGRRVALKAMRPERLGSIEAQTRFQREIDAVSELRHPSIVTVFGSGEEQGVRYFVMEYVPGQGLDAILREARLHEARVPIPQVLEWTREIASALQSAHEAQILHRDLKPSNIVITPEGRAMLMDFGVARHLNLSTLTLTGEFRGTPNYASPEQIHARRGSIGAQTDIYSLGVTLYEAVTGAVPFQGETTEQVFKKILDEEPLPPRKLNPSISRDLETVILTALEKAPERRYPCMADFGEDLKRIVQGEMITARPAGMATRMMKRVRRNPVLSGVLLAAGLLLLCFFGYVLWSYPQILEERDRAEAQREAALEAKRVAEIETEKFQAINRFLEGMLASPDPSVSGRELKVADLLGNAAEQIGYSFNTQPAIKSALLDTIGKTFAGLGLLAEAETQLAAALALRREVLGEEHPDTILSMNNLAIVYRKQRRDSEAENLLRKVIETNRERFGEEDAITLASMGNLGLVLKDQGKLDEAEALQKKVLGLHRRVHGEASVETLRAVNNLASTYWQQRKYTEAEALQEKVLEAKRAMLGEEHPSTLITLNNLAITLKQQGRLDEAEKLQRELLDVQSRVLGEEHPDTLSAMYNLANTLKAQARYAEAEALQRKVLEARQRSLGALHEDTLASLHYLAILCWESGKPEEAEALFQEVIAKSRKSLGADHADTLLAVNNLICLYTDQARHEKAAPLFEEAIAVCARTPGRALKVAEYEVSYAKNLIELNRFEDAEARLLSGYRTFKEAQGDSGERTRDTIDQLVALYERWGKPERAEVFRALLARDPDGSQDDP
jgi:tetratricopeptide (TPR) repeat protein